MNCSDEEFKYHFSWFGVFMEMMHCVTLANAEILYNSVIPSEIISFFGGMLTFHCFPKSSSE